MTQPQTTTSQADAAEHPAGMWLDTDDRSESSENLQGIPAELIFGMTGYDTDSAGGCG